MTDAHLRALERAFRLTGTGEDEAAWLRARVQAGELAHDRLRLAAYVGHEAATLALRPHPPDSPEALDRWLRRLSVHWEQEASARAALAAVAASPPELQARTFVAAAVSLAEPWVLAPATRGDVPALPGVFSDAEFEAPEEKRAWVVGIYLHRTLESPAGWGRSVETLALSIQSRWPAAPVRDAVARELAEWALGYSDPVRERVEAGQREAARD